MDTQVILDRLQRFLLKLDTGVFEEMRDDTTATIPALIIAAVSFFLFGLGGWFWWLVEGFTDNVGSDWDNLVLARDRANHGALALAFLGIAPERIHIDPIGARSYVAPNTTNAHRARNRRIVFTVTRPGP